MNVRRMRKNLIGQNKDNGKLERYLEVMVMIGSDWTFDYK